MFKPITLFITVLLIALAGNNSLAQTNKNILGDWKEVKRITKSGAKVPDGRMGFSFYTNNTFINKQGFFRHDAKSNVFLGNTAKYVITGNSLKVYSPEKKAADILKIYKLSKDSLIIGIDEEKIIFARYKSYVNQSPEFDRIVLSTTGCYGECPSMKISIDKTGLLLFQGDSYTTKIGVYQSSISKALYKKLQDSFRVIDFKTLKSKYSANWTDDETISVSFIKNGHIYKTVNDYGGVAPAEFTWAYPALRYLYQKVNLKKVQYHTLLGGYISRRIKKGNKILDISKSEVYLLNEYLRKGKIILGKVTDGYFIDIYNADGKVVKKVITDGRYYSFIRNGKVVTIDIGFEFVRDVEKFHQWRKVIENDRHQLLASPL
ncbi:hypothetical protein EOD41_18190 [Mucilaginibacter limnophilus]|uniref:DUF6438 domain-containing protein n=1 Tax=Mucilaginibacter limnophilus TaxID=1932778 RepID=A0A3S2UJ11_9SPHI|nr:DUF6438 domain-containing protein [Mucilaginibacter limnophilus]RVT98018.1 hypothetical protein EOD41_18190 [Mucilaginibacter limnophilus]